MTDASRPRSLLLTGLALLLPLALATAGERSDPPQPQRPGQQLDDAQIDRLLDLHHVDRQKIRLILLPAVVEGKRGKLIRGLEKDDFSIFEDYVPQKIRFFATEETEPVSITFLLDLSGSMRQVGKLDEAKTAIEAFVGSLRPEDRIGLIGFADEQVTWITELTRDRERFLKRLSVQEAYGQTALYDAVARAPAMVDEHVRGRASIVLITDGIDTSSEMNTFDAMRLARSVNVPIYSIGFSSLPRNMLARGSKLTTLRVLEMFSQETGGLLLTVHKPQEMGDAVERITRDLRFQYVIGYYPTRREWDGSYRRIKLDLNRDKLTVRTRKGYYANP